MPSCPDPALRKEHIAQRLLQYLHLAPLSVEHRLELALDIVREMPENATADDAMARLQALLKGRDASDATPFPPQAPPLRRRHMTAQNLRRPQTASQAKARKASRFSQFLFLLFLAALVGLTLLFTLAVHWGAAYVA